MCLASSLLLNTLTRGYRALYNCASQQPIVFGFQKEPICSLLVTTVILIDPYITQPNEKHHDNTGKDFSACISADDEVYEQESRINMLHWKQQSHIKQLKNNNRCTIC